MSSNQTIRISMNDLRQTFSTTQLVHYGTIYALTPLSLISAAINLIAYIILRKEPFSLSIIFRYIRMNVLNSFVISILLATRFTATTYSVFDFTNSYGALFYGSYIYVPFLSIFYLNGNLLNICITIERIMNFRPLANLKRMMELKYFWLILFTVSIVVNVPNFFTSCPGFVDYRVENNLTIRNYIHELTKYSTSVAGKVSAFFIYLMRDVLTLVITIALNLVSISLIKKYIKKISINLKVVRTLSAQEILIIGGYSVKKRYMSVVERNLTLTTLSMSVLSSFENLINIAFFISIVLKYDDTALNLYFYTNLLVAIKYSSNLFILYLFNTVFKKELKNLFSFWFKKLKP